MNDFDKLFDKLDQVKDAITGLQKDFSHMKETVSSHSVELWGDTSESKPGLVKKIDRILEKQKDRNKLAAIFGSIIGFLGIDWVYRILKAFGINPPNPH